MVVVSAASFRYDDGKKLTGIGTRASKSRLTTYISARERLLEFPFDVCERKTRRGLLLLLKEGEGRKRWITLLNSVFQLRGWQRRIEKRRMDEVYKIDWNVDGFCVVWRNGRRELESAVAGVDICCSFVYALAGGAVAHAGG